jgi:hypothetical protein
MYTNYSKLEDCCLKIIMSHVPKSKNGTQNQKSPQTNLSS